MIYLAGLFFFYTNSSGSVSLSVRQPTCLFHEPASTSSIYLKVSSTKCCFIRHVPPKEYVEAKPTWGGWEIQKKTKTFFCSLRSQSWLSSTLGHQIVTYVLWQHWPRLLFHSIQGLCCCCSSFTVSALSRSIAFGLFLVLRLVMIKMLLFLARSRAWHSFISLKQNASSALRHLQTI